MEYMQGGSLTDTIERSLSLLTEARMANIVKGTLAGLKHLHSQGTIHRDIKSDNILLGRDGAVKLSVYTPMRCEILNGCLS
jgi:serine/threonine protein kinase